MDSILRNLAQLAEAIKNDRDIYVDHKDVLLDALGVGEGLIETRDTSQDGIDYMEDVANMDNDSSLFVNDNPMNDDLANVDDEIQEDDDPDNDQPLKWLNKLRDQIVSHFSLTINAVHCFSALLLMNKQTSLHATTSTAHEPTPCPRLAIEPQPHQRNTLARIKHNRGTPLKAILVRDGPRLGKTLPAIMAVVKAKFESAGAAMPSIIVVLSSCVPQWRSEFTKFFLLVYILLFFT